MANVYQAFDEINQEEVALKVLHRQLGEDKVHVERFLREARLMTSIESTKVVRAFDFGTDGPNVYMSMEYIRGCSLAKLLDKHSFQPEEIAYILSEVSKGVEAVHSKRIIYRDLKPANILVSKYGEIKLTDFGVAKEEGSKLTGTTQRLGSICYIPPEIWLGKKATPAADLYSLGIVAYELATGQVPFESPYPGAIMEQHISEPVNPPREINPRISGWLNHLIVSLLAKKPKNRPTAIDVITECNRNVLANFDVEAVAAGIGKLVETFREPDSESEKSTRALVRDEMDEFVQTDPSPRRGKTYILRLSATEIFDFKKTTPQTTEHDRSVTISIPLPQHSAIIFEIERPSRDFIFLGLFLVSLQIFDAMLTAEGIRKLSIEAEGNSILKYFMHKYGVEDTLLITKGLAIMLVLAMTKLAQKLHWIRNLIAVMSVFYLLFAIIPWLIVLRLSSH